MTPRKLSCPRPASQLRFGRTPRHGAPVGRSCRRLSAKRIPAPFCTATVPGTCSCNLRSYFNLLIIQMMPPPSRHPHIPSVPRSVNLTDREPFSPGSTLNAESASHCGPSCTCRRISFRFLRLAAYSTYRSSVTASPKPPPGHGLSGYKCPCLPPNGGCPTPSPTPPPGYISCEERTACSDAVQTRGCFMAGLTVTVLCVVISSIVIFVEAVGALNALGRVCADPDRSKPWVYEMLSYRYNIAYLVLADILPDLAWFVLLVWCERSMIAVRCSVALIATEAEYFREDRVAVDRCAGCMTGSNTALLITTILLTILNFVALLVACTWFSEMGLINETLFGLMYGLKSCGMLISWIAIYLFCLRTGAVALHEGWLAEQPPTAPGVGAPPAAASPADLPAAPRETQYRRWRGGRRCGERAGAGDASPPGQARWRRK